MAGSREREYQTAIQRIYALPLAWQHRALDDLTEHLGLPIGRETSMQKEARLRGQAVADIRTATEFRREPLLDEREEIRLGLRMQTQYQARRFRRHGLATTLGVKRDIEMVTHHSHATAYYFVGEVFVTTKDRFPWCLMRTEAWSAWCEFEEHAREFGLD